MINVKKIRKDFPVLTRLIGDKPLIYLDSTASSLKPKDVIDRGNEYYEKYCVNIFRRVYTLSEEATAAYEESRDQIAEFIGCKDSKEITFVRNATEAINLVAYSYGRKFIRVNDEIISTVMEHHANIVPWQVLCREKKAQLKYLDIDANGYLDISNLDNILTKKTRLVVLTQYSNVLGTINPVREIITRIKKYDSGIKILVDAAQSVPHMKTDVSGLGCDFFAFSGHKMLGPTGIGVLWAKRDLLESMDPYQTGGDMIKEVTLKYSTYNDIPNKFEAGTPNIVGAIGLGEASSYLEKIGMEEIREHEKNITEYALLRLKNIDKLRIYGPLDVNFRGGVITFNIDGVHPHDVAQILNNDNICIRSGHHCAMPLHTKLGITASCRASFYIYNVKEEVDKLVEGLENVKKIFGV